jgi:hypothetical protein
MLLLSSVHLAHSIPVDVLDFFPLPVCYPGLVGVTEFPGHGVDSWFVRMRRVRGVNVVITRAARRNGIRNKGMFGGPEAGYIRLAIEIT